MKHNPNYLTMRQIIKCGIIALLAMMLFSSCDDNSTNNDGNTGTGTYNYQQVPVNQGYQQVPMNNGGYMYQANSYSGRSAYEIRYELNKAYELLYDMQEQMNNSTGVTRSMYPQMIADQKQFILRLENELANATH